MENDRKAKSEKAILKETFSEIVNQCMEDFIKNASDKMADKYKNATLKAMEEWASDTLTPSYIRTRQGLSDKIDYALKMNCTPHQFKLILEEEYKKMLEKCRQQLQEAINEKMIIIYNSHLDKNCYQLDDKKWSQIVESCSVENLSVIDSTDYFQWNRLLRACRDIAITFTMAEDYIFALVNNLLDTGLPINNFAKHKKYLWNNELPEYVRERMLNKTKSSYKQTIQETLTTHLTNEINTDKQPQIEQLAIDALEEAFDIIAFYG